MPSEKVGMCLETLVPGMGKITADEFARIANAVAAAGFEDVALWSWRATNLGVDTTTRILGDAGLHVQLVECQTFWADGPEAAERDLDVQLDLAEEVGAPRILAVAQQMQLELGRATEGFAALCERADQRGIQASIEFLPCRALCDLATAWTIVRQSGAANGGLDIDFMHWQYQPGGPDLALLRSIPGQHIHYVQLCDAAGPAPAREDYIEAAITGRRIPGEGDVDVAGLLNAIQDSGADPFWALEVFNAELLAEGPEHMAARLRPVADSLFS